MEGFATVRAASTSAPLDRGVRPKVEWGRDSSSRKRSHPPVCEERGLMGDLLSGCRVEEGC